MAKPAIFDDFFNYSFKKSRFELESLIRTGDLVIIDGKPVLENKKHNPKFVYEMHAPETRTIYGRETSEYWIGRHVYQKEIIEQHGGPDWRNYCEEAEDGNYISLVECHWYKTSWKLVNKDE